MLGLKVSTELDISYTDCAWKFLNPILYLPVPLENSLTFYFMSSLSVRS